MLQILNPFLPAKMKFSASLAAIALFVTASQSSPIDIEERGPSAKVTLCDKPNMQDCDTMYIPVNSCCKDNSQLLWSADND